MEKEYEIYVWSDAEQDYVLVYRGTDEKEAKRAQRSFLNRQTRARNKRKKLISEIIREEKLYSYEDALDHLNNLVNGGKVAAVLLKHMGADKGHWEHEIMQAKRKGETMVKQIETVRISSLYNELDRLKERFRDEPVAIEALEAVMFWATEEEVPGVDAGKGAQTDRGANTGHD